MKTDLTLTRLMSSLAGLVSKARKFTWPSQLQETGGIPGCPLFCEPHRGTTEGSGTCAEPVSLGIKYTLKC